MARDDTGLGYLGDVNPIALANIEAQGATNGRGRSEPKGGRLRDRARLSKRVRPAYPVGRGESNGVRLCPAYLVAPNWLFEE